MCCSASPVIVGADIAADRFEPGIEVMRIVTFILLKIKLINIFATFA
jgi:hypothetical protein